MVIQQLIIYLINYLGMDYKILSQGIKMVYGKRTRGKRSGSTRAMVKSEIDKALAKTTEVKHDDNNWGFNATDKPIAINLVDYIEQGDGASKRDGNRINLLSCSMRCNINTDVAASRVRMAVVETREPLELVSGQSWYDARPLFESLTNLKTNAFFDMDTVKRVLFNRHIQFTQLFQQGQDAGGTPLPINQEKYVNKYIKFGTHGKRIFYDGDYQAAPNLGANTKTYIYFVVLGDEPSSSISGIPAGTMAWKLRFTDK